MQVIGCTEMITVMLKQYNKISLRLGIMGFSLQSLGLVIRVENRAIENLWLVLPVLFVGTTLFVVGLAYYAVGKGHRGWWGFCGCLGILGMIALLLLEDRAPNE